MRRPTLLLALFLATACGQDQRLISGSIDVVAADGTETSFEFSPPITLLDVNEPGSDELFSGGCWHAGGEEGQWNFSVIRPSSAPSGLGLERVDILITSGGTVAVDTQLGGSEYSGVGRSCTAQMNVQGDDGRFLYADYFDFQNEGVDESMGIEVSCEVEDGSGATALVSADLWFGRCEQR